MQDLGVDGRIIIKWFFETLDGDMEWINLAQNTDRFGAFVNRSKRSHILCRG
jgi:hypothetical protein